MFVIVFDLLDLSDFHFVFVGFRVWVAGVLRMVWLFVFHCYLFFDISLFGFLA